MSWFALYAVHHPGVAPNAPQPQVVKARQLRFLIGLPPTVALCWSGLQWFDTRYDLVIAIYAAVLVRLLAG